MLFYSLYLLGLYGCLIIPKAVCYQIARWVADLYCRRAVKDRQAVKGNLSAILGTSEVSDAQVRELFRNFAMYLVDFFRFSRLDAAKVQRLVRVDGLERMRQALAGGRGVVGLTAHLGNYELAGAVLSLAGLPVNAVVLSHRNRRVDDFFTRQRSHVEVKGIPIQRMGLKAFFQTCLSALERNQILALVGDRDFFDHGLVLPFFGRTLRVPTGPANFSFRTGAPIVPAFLVREPDGGYRFIIESPIVPPQGLGREAAVRQMTESSLKVMETYIRRYPTQWYMFQEFWNPGPAVVL
ncbi:MAG: lysophospholipid acyltransferase family protein [Candidatus Omnitrophica bacterium]|nr:lysophospholipid acyltransferase family protein [Candidatus Omnitrophota bacterium]